MRKDMYAMMNVKKRSRLLCLPTNVYLVRVDVVAL